MKKYKIFKPLIKSGIFAAIVGGVFALLAVFAPDKDDPATEQKDTGKERAED